MLSRLFHPEKPTRRQFLVMVLICIIGSTLCMGLMKAKSKTENPFYADALQYTGAAFNLYHHGVFSQGVKEGPIEPGIGREPGWPFVLYLFGQVDHGFQSLTVDCLSQYKCTREQANGIQWLNRILFAGAGVFMFVSGYLVTGRMSGAMVAGGAIWLNKHMQKNMDYVVSDPLALFLAAAVICMFALAYVRRSNGLWLLGGLVLAALALTKAIFYYFGLVFLAGWAVVWLVRLVREKTSPVRTLVPMVAFALFFLVPLWAWMARNEQVSGDFRLTDDRAGIALNTREILNHMTPAQYFTSFLYWTRGFGDNLARDLLPKSIWDEFQIDNPKGFYLTAQLGYGPKVQQKQKELGVSYIEAQKIVDGELMNAIITNPLTHIAVTIPVIYRGLWVDQFAWFSVPALIWVLFLCLKRREGMVFVLLSPALFNIVFYATFSLNIPRYQMTAGPGLALALAIAYVILAERGVFARWKNRILRRKSGA